MDIRHTVPGLLMTVALLLVQGKMVQAQEITPAMIVVFHEDASFETFGPMYQPDDREHLNPEGWHYLDRTVAGAVQALEARLGFRAHHVYSTAIRGFAARLTRWQISALENHPLVASVEPDGIMRTQMQEVPWGIQRIGADQSSIAAGDGQGAVTNVNVYIIDTGTDIMHADLNLEAHVKLIPPTSFVNRDCNGHGTHVAGTLSASDNNIDVVGVAPGAPLFVVKVLNCFGTGNASDIIKAVDVITAYGQKPAVVNMSLGGGLSQALDLAVINSVIAGFFYAVAAGNDGANACNYSPARAGLMNGVMSVAATDSAEQEAGFSNFGVCVDIWAPGVDILSTALGGGTRTLSGTSMAAPHVAGAAALYLSSNPTATPAQVESAIKAAAVSTGTTSKDGRPIIRLHVGSF